jgi:hypothetical protein
VLTVSLDSVLKVVQIGAYAAGAISALCALKVYFSNARRERAHWVESLYSRFYEKQELKDMREKLDCEAGTPEIRKLVSEEKQEWTDYLNFFELVAYLQESEQIEKEDVDALFRYPLSCLKRHPEVIAYVRDEANDYQSLNRKLSQNE